MDTLEPTRAQTRARIDTLRRVLREHAIDALVIPSSDPHLSEYLPARWQGRAWASGFTGSVGTLVVCADFAGVWVDSRYWVQAEAELAGTGVELMKIASAASPGHVDWLRTHLKPAQVVAVDAAVLSLAAARQLADAVDAAGAKLNTAIDLLGLAWPDRPGLPTAPVYEHVAPYAATTRADKLKALRLAAHEAGAQWHWLSTLDDIAWAFNLRGADVNYNPVFLSHALIGPSQATLFVADGKIDASLRARLADDGVNIAPYAQARAQLAQLPTDAVLLIDPRRVTLGARQAVPASVRVIEAINPSTLAKSRKTEAEIAQVRAAMEQDGAALAEFFAWFEQALGRETITELTIDERVTAARARRPGYVSPSFGTIAGFNANGAMPHYRATDAAHATLSRPGGLAAEGLLLIDSGGQYLGGTTDITRVVAVGTPSAAQKHDFTLVLKGMIALSRTHFPRGTRSPVLDAIARAPIWSGGVDYGHGTGHGVGYFLNVHEGPQTISPHAPTEPQTAMEPGMITSNEPGIYRPGRWGVRIENLLLNVVHETTEFGEFLRFETLTLCPIDTRCIERRLLTDEEADWLNAYHTEVRTRVAPHVQGAALAWLERSTQPI